MASKPILCAWCTSNIALTPIVFPLEDLQKARLGDEGNARRGWVCANCVDIMCNMEANTHFNIGSPKTYSLFSSDMTEEDMGKYAMLKLVKQNTLRYELGMRTWWFTMIFTSEDAEERVSSSADGDPHA